MKLWLLWRRRLVLDLEPGLIKDHVLDEAFDGQLHTQLLLNQQLDDVLLLFLLLVLLLLLLKVAMMVVRRMII